MSLLLFLKSGHILQLTFCTCFMPQWVPGTHTTLPSFSPEVTAETGDVGLSLVGLDLAILSVCTTVARVSGCMVDGNYLTRLAQL